ASFLYPYIRPPPPRFPLFPYTTLFRSRRREDPASRSISLTNRKLVAWCALVGTLAALGYAQRFGSGKPPRNALYHYDIAISELRSEEHTSELQSRSDLVCRLLLEKKKK